MSDAHWLKVQDERVMELETALQQIEKQSGEPWVRAFARMALNGQLSGED